jgi:hypothetical protein
MLSPDHILINRATRILGEYRSAERPRKGVRVAGLTVFLPITLAATAYLIEPFVPAKPPELVSLNFGTFAIAVAVARLCGGAGAWVAASVALLIIAWIASPMGSLVVEPAAWPWFGFIVIMLAVIAATAPRDPIRWPPLTWRRDTAQPPRKGLKKGQRRLVVDDSVTVPIPR